MARLKEIYRNEIAPKLKEDLKLANVMEVPRITKITLNMGLGEAIGDTAAPEGVEATLARLGGFGEALLLDQQASGATARTELGWAPTRPTLVEELRAGYAPRA